MKSLLFAALLTVAVSMALGQAYAFEPTVTVSPQSTTDHLLMIAGSIVGTAVLFMSIRHMYGKSWVTEKPMMP